MGLTWRQIERAEVKSAYKIKHMFKKDRIRFATSVCVYVCAEIVVEKIWGKKNFVLI